MSNYTHIGYIARVHGYKGNVIAKITYSNPGILNNIEAVFVEMQGATMPFVTDRFTIQKKDQALIKFKTIHTEAEAKQMVGAKLVLPVSVLPQDDKPNYVGFSVVNEVGEVVGEVKDFMEVPGNPLLVLDDEGDIMIPFTKALIISIDEKKRSIQMTIPQGLLDG